jgi:hypothetical protein
LRAQQGIIALPAKRKKLWRTGFQWNDKEEDWRIFKTSHDFREEAITTFAEAETIPLK